MDIRLLLISHASTAAMRAGRFPADDPLDARGLAEADAARARLLLADDATVRVSPARCAIDTAAALGLIATIDSNLADIDYGTWQGRRLADLANEAPEALTAWASDPQAAAHGGESFSQAIKRVGGWLDTLASQQPLPPSQHKLKEVIAVTHAAVIRAALVHVLGAAPEIFPRIDIAPLSMVELRNTRRGWVWRPA
ncbi:histidine phosphatase family protein [Paraburkholderia sp. BCC1886]|uniref:histidine phosphatase family protein n=1 Tax=Paraburkholderia sp. BCC1886 TaxID=2562670 RepID=UPI0011824E27|nr:histidine phosphatase family protein [Paraburkholderia sp. BCC1886]